MRESPKSSLKIGLRLLAAAGGVAAALLLAEAGLRLRYFGAQALLHPGRYSPRPIPMTGLWAGYGLKPASRGYFKGAPFSVNSLGLRGPEAGRRKPAGVYRIAVVGDSFTMGAGVSDDEAYPRRLEKLLSARCGRPFEVLNFGVGGYDFPQLLADACGRAKTFSPDMVLVGFDELNDLPRKAGPVWSEQDKLPSLERQAPDSFLAALASEYWRGRKDAGWEQRDNQTVDWAGFSAGLARLRACTSRPRLPVAFALLQSVSCRRYPWSSRLRAALARARFPVIDTAPAFAGRDLRKYWIYTSDAHPNGAADELYARSIADALLSTVLKRECAADRKHLHTAHQERRT